MNVASIEAVLEAWPVRADLDAVDEVVAGKRGPKPAVSLHALCVTMVCLLLDQKPAHLKAAWRALAVASNKELKLLGLKKAPTYRQLCLTVERLRRHIDEEDSERKERVQQLLDMLVPASAGASTDTTMWAVDTTLFDGFCRWVKKTEHCSDPDATWRKIDRPNGSAKTYLGYAAIAVVRADGDGPEVCDRVTLTSANEDDARPATELSLRLRDAGLDLRTLIADRGFSQKPDSFQVPLRAAGIECCFDLKKDDIGVGGTYQSGLIIDGWLFSPGIPERLKRFERPGPTASPADQKKFRELMAQRMRWAFLPHAAAEPHRVRVASPVKRGRIKCRTLPPRAQTDDPSAPTCRKAHLPDMACGINTTFFPATAAPRTFQYPAWGTPEWSAIYNKRSAVERYFGRLKDDAGVGFRRGRFQLRGLANMALITGLAMVATNIKLRQARAELSTT